MNFNKCLEQLRLSLKANGYILNETTFDKAKHLFLLCDENAEYIETLRQRAPEYGKMEFFLNVDNRCSVVYPSKALIKDFKATQEQKEDFRLWFQEDWYSKKPILLVARWLSHLVGFRHRCAYIFLDHSTLEDYTFVQIRSFGKDDSPGCLDIPVGGHAKCISTLEETAKEELKDELNLDLQSDIEGFCLASDYGYYEPPKRPDFYNIEHRTVFCGRLKSEAMPKIKFLDGEVAAICVFSILELEILLKNFPERVASGLLRSFHIYIKHKQLRARNSR